MKLRMRGNSLRLRLLQGEVKRLKNDGRVEESVDFGLGQKLVYALETSRDVSSISASFLQNRIQIVLPHNTVADWVESPKIGLLAEQSLAHDQTLKILIEKDFLCLKPRTMNQIEDESDAFPNPNESCGDHASH